LARAALSDLLASQDEAFQAALLFGAFVGWSMSQGRAAAPAELEVAKAA
jgi:hypothetical protein